MKPVIWIMQLDVERYRSFSNTPKGWEKWLYWRDKFLYPGSFFQEWIPVEKMLFEGNPGEKRKERRKPIPDFTNGYVVDSCSDRARRVIEPLVQGQIEFLPLTTPVGPYWEMNIQRLECLDTARSEIDYLYPEEKRKIFKVLKYAFHWDRLMGQHIFWIQEVGKHPTFVSDEFKRLIEENSLTGLEFLPVPLVEE